MPTYNKAELDGTTLIDLSQDTVASASHIRQGYVGHLNDGTQATGTYSGEVTMPIYTATVDGQTGTITVTCDWSYDDVADYCNYDAKFAAMLRTTVDGGVTFIESPMAIYVNATPTGIYGVVIDNYGLPTADIFHTSNGITTISPSSALAQLSATQNGTYNAPQGKLYNEVSVNVSGGGANFATATMTNSSNQAQSIDFTLPAGRTVKACFARLTTQVQRNSSYRYYFVFCLRWDGSATGGVEGTRFYQYNGQLTNVTSGYSHTQSGTTFTLSTTGTRAASPGSFYNGTYELVYVY